MKSIISFLAALPLAMAAGDATVYLIRHGEKPANGSGLSAAGMQRAQCITNVFGESSSYDIGHIMAETPQAGEKSSHPITAPSKTTPF